MDTTWIGTASIAFFATLCLIWFLRPVAIHVGLVDRPDARKRHQDEVPLVGGIAIFLGIAATEFLAGGATHHEYAIFAAGALLLAMGIADDFYNLGAKRRLVGQAAAALIIIYGADVVLRDFGDLFAAGTISLGLLAVPITVFCFVGVINAMNMVDGIDGLAGGLTLVTVSALIYLSASAGTPHLQLLVQIAGAIAGFLVLNARSPFLARAKIFMGDAGSMVLGCIIAATLIDMSQGPARVLSPAAALWLFALPLMDTVRLMATRVLRGQSPFTPGRDHVHHILLASGLSVSQTVAALIATEALLAAIGIAGQQLGLSEGGMFFSFLGLFGLYCWTATRGLRLARVNRYLHVRRTRIVRV